MSSATAEQTLLYSLRSPTTPLPAKLVLAQAALENSPSPALSQVLRDWILQDLFLRSKAPATLVSPEWWILLSQVVESAAGTTSTPTLPIFTSFLGTYAGGLEANVELVGAVVSVCRKLIGGAMRKATVDAALEGYAVLLKSSLAVMQRNGADTDAWESLTESWLKAFRGVVDAGKGGKKIPLHTLAQLPTILLLLRLLSPISSSLYSSLLVTIQFSLFNVDNLRRGIARESYHAGGTSAAEKQETTEVIAAAEGELLNALRACLSSTPALRPDVLYALPLLFNLYRTSLATHSTILFPLPARTSFASASSAQSALEIHSLQKRRALAAGWLRGVATLLGWKDVDAKVSPVAETVCLGTTLEEIESGDLFREVTTEGWEGLLEGIVAGAVGRIEVLGEGEAEAREALVGLLGTSMRLSFPSVEASLPSILKSLAATSFTASASTSKFLTALLTHHTRSVLLPTLLILLSNALASPSARPNSILTSHAWNAELAKALNGLVGNSVKSCWDDIVSGIALELSTSEPVVVEQPSKKRRKTSTATTPVVASGAAARARVLTLLVRALPLPIPMALFDEFRKAYVEDAVVAVVEGKGKGKAGVEMLGARYAMVERMRLDGVDESDDWEWSGETRKGLLSLVESSEDGQVVLEVARTLLQSIVPATTEEEARDVLSSVLARISASDTASSWSGLIQGLEGAEISAALWELITRRWLPLFEHFGSSEHLSSLASIILRALGSTTSSTATQSLIIDSITARLLRRADFYELRRLQSHIQPALLTLVTIPTLTPPSQVLLHLSASKVPKALRSLSIESIEAVVASFKNIATLLPIEYVGKGLRNDLIDRAVSLDVWISGGKVEMNEEGKTAAQSVLRRFVGMAAAEGSSINEGPAILSHLVKNTSRDVSDLTISLYRHFVSSAIASYKSEKSPSALIAYLQAFASPLSDLAKRYKKHSVGLTCEEIAFFALCEMLASNLGDYTSVPTELAQAIVAALDSATKPFSKAISYITASLASETEGTDSPFIDAEILDACKSIWRLKDWVQGGTGDCEQVEIYSSFAQSILQKLATGANKGEDAQTLKTRLAMLDLLSFRIARLRSLSNNNVATLPFETFLACHLNFRSLGTPTLSMTKALGENLKRATSATTLREYSAALEGIAATVAFAVAEQTTQDSLGPALEVALVLLRDGPEGSSRLSSQCLSSLLQHLTLFVLRLTTATAHVGASTAKAFLVVSEFLEGICGDRPMLLSRQNVSSILTLVARMLEPTAATDSTITSLTSSTLASSLFLSLVSTVSHLVRHRKDHLTPLFPSLIGTITSFLSNLRRAGFGTTGRAGTVVLKVEGEVDAEGAEETIERRADDGGMAWGKRAERDARATFPFWVWEGGAHSIGRKEAKAVGRLLSSLTTKTAVLVKKRSRAPSTAEAAPTPASTNTASTSSLAAPLSKHAPMLLLPYLRCTVDAISPIPSVLRSELQGGWGEVMETMGKWEREALMKGFLGEAEEAERGVLRGMWRSWERERYRG